MTAMYPLISQDPLAREYLRQNGYTDKEIDELFDAESWYHEVKLEFIATESIPARKPMTVARLNGKDIWWWDGHLTLTDRGLGGIGSYEVEEYDVGEGPDPDNGKLSYYSAGNFDVLILRAMLAMKCKELVTQ